MAKSASTQNEIFFREDFQATPASLKDLLTYPASWTDKEIHQYLFCLEYARRAHDGAYRKGTHIPYITHPVEASLITMDLTDDIGVVEAALLHDVVEDTGRTIEDIRDMFGDVVAEYVLMASENKRPELPPDCTWKIRKSEYLNHLKIASFNSKVLAVADKLSNIRAMARDFKSCGNAMWQKFNQKDKREQAWYYFSVCNLTKELDSSVSWQEMKALCEEVFADVMDKAQGEARVTPSGEG